MGSEYAGLTSTVLRVGVACWTRGVLWTPQDEGHEALNRRGLETEDGPTEGSTLQLGGSKTAQ